MRLLAPLRHAVFRRFFVGQAVSQFGDSVFFVALAWQVILLTDGSGVALGTMFSVFMAAQVVFLLAGGVVVDRFPRRTLVVLSDVAQGALSGVIALLAFSGLLEMWHLYVIAALFGAAQAIAMPALGAFVPETVPAEHLQGANSLYQGTRTLAQVAGPALGAGVIALGGTGVAFGLNAVSFAVSAALLATARMAGLPRPEAPTTTPIHDVKEGFRYVRNVPWLWITILVYGFVNVAEAGPRNVVWPLFITETLGSGVEGIGLVLSAHGAGALAGLLAMGALPPIRRRGALAYAMTAAGGVSMALFAPATSLPPVLVLSFLHGAAFGVFGLLWHTNVMEEVPERLRGRVFSVDMLVSFGLLPVSMALTGVLAATVGTRATLLAGGVAMVLLALVGLYRPARGFTAFERGEA